MRTVAVVQARMGSTRFPGKVLADLRGRPLLAHVVSRVQRSRCVDTVVVATSTAPGDDAVATMAESLGAAAVRGPEEDVLARFVIAAREHHADVVVRITADCPLLDPRIVDRVVHALRRDDADYACNIVPPTYPDGYDVEAFTAACLARMDSEATLAYEREHVTPRAREHPNRYRVAMVRCRRDLSAVRLTVDVPADLDRIAAILTALPSDPPPGLGAVLAHLQRTPSLSMQKGLPQRDERYLAQRSAAGREETSA